MLQVYNSVSGIAWRCRWPNQLRMRTRRETELSKRLITMTLWAVCLFFRVSAAPFLCVSPTVLYFWASHLFQFFLNSASHIVLSAVDAPTPLRDRLGHPFCHLAPSGLASAYFIRPFRDPPMPFAPLPSLPHFPSLPFSAKGWIILIRLQSTPEVKHLITSYIMCVL